MNDTLNDALNEMGQLDRESAARSDDLMEVRLWLRMLTCTKLIGREVGARLGKQFDITLPRFDVLAQLERAPDGLTMGELSRRMMVTHGNITGLVDRLVKDGLVDRRPIEGNRRANLVKLTQAGHATFTELAAAHHRWVCGLLRRVEHDDVERTFELLARVKSSLTQEILTQETSGPEPREEAAP
ncbi:MAG: MarR family transcriptional regulator [Alphaproteobacteria bacterium]|nr:MarR family transcriptional regulator [Alphaproteobacteria bacterium]